MFRNPITRFLAISAVFAVAVASAQSKIAVINTQRAIMETAEIKKASADLEEKYKPRTSEADKLRKEVETIQQQLKSMAGKLTPQGEAELITQGQRKQRDLQRVTEDLQADVDLERNDILTKSQQRMQEVINKIAASKDLDIIIDISNTLYFKPALDITQEAISAYDAAYPVK